MNSAVCSQMDLMEWSSLTSLTMKWLIQTSSTSFPTPPQLHLFILPDRTTITEEMEARSAFIIFFLSSVKGVIRWTWRICVCTVCSSVLCFMTGPECRSYGVPRGGSKHPAAANGFGLLCLHSQDGTIARLVLVSLSSGPEPVSSLPKGAQSFSIIFKLFFILMGFLIAIGTFSISIFSPNPRLLCTCTCLLSNQTSSSTVSTPTPWTLITHLMCSGKEFWTLEEAHVQQK